MRATGFNHVSIRARDLAESVRFYVDLFAMEPVATPNFGFPVQWLRLGDLQLHLFERPDDSPTYHHFGIAVDDFEAVYVRAKELGILDEDTFGSALYELPGRCAQLYIRDPGGNLVEIDWPDVTTLDPSVVGELPRLADRQPQSAENERSTLFF